MLGQYLTDWFSLLRVGDTRPIVLGSWTEAPPRPNSGTGFLFGLRGCRRTTSITSSTPPAGMSSSIGRPRRSAAFCAAARSSTASSRTATIRGA